MKKIPGTAWILLAATVLLAGCATNRDSTYSSIPAPPAHPGEKAPMDRATVTIHDSGLSPGGGREVPHLPHDQYADILDRIRDGYGLQDVQNFAVDREVETYRNRPDFLDRTF